MTKKPSFFERLTGSIPINEAPSSLGMETERTIPQKNNDWIEEESDEGELTVDVYQSPDEIVVKAMIAGVKPEDLDVSITRDMVTIRGKREESREIAENDYFYKELYWGSFSRTILLPQEIEPEEAEAIEKHGLLTIHLPKVDKKKVAKLKVRSN